jgi:hypothetical protein
MIVEVVEGQTLDGVRINADLFSTPPQASPIVFRQTSISTEDEEGNKPHVAVAEIPSKPIRFFVIVKRAEPVHQLAEAVLEARAPLGHRFVGNFPENTVRLGVFELDDAEGACVLVADHDVGREIPEERELKCDQADRADPAGICPNQRGQLFPFLEEVLDVFPFRQFLVPVQQFLEGSEFYLASRWVEHDFFQTLRHWMVLKLFPGTA